jgi:tripartite ATP-independent transporter DctM subunit
MSEGLSGIGGMLLGLSDLSLGIWGIVAILAGLLLLKVPPGFIMAMVGFGGFAAVTGWESAFSKLGGVFWSVFSRYEFSVIPMFVLVGEIIFYAGYSDRLYRSTYQWCGHVRGGLGITTILASAGFSAICGSNTATAATMSAVAIPSMRRYKYHPLLMAGTVAAGATLGVMVPPSIVLVVYGLQTRTSITQLFAGTLLPSAMLMTTMAATTWLLCLRHRHWGPPGERATWRQRLAALPGVLDILALFAVIMAGMFSGVFTATEAAAVSSFLALVLVGLRRKLTLAGLRSAVADTLRISCMVLLIIAGARLFGEFLTITRLPQEIAAGIGGLDWPHWAVLAVMLGVYALGGCLMDALAFLLVSLPIFMPVVSQMGYDPVWFGVMVCLVTTLGAITPPIGICCFVISGMSRDVRIEQAFRGAMYFLPSYVLVAVLMMLFPRLSVLALADLFR